MFAKLFENFGNLKIKMKKDKKKKTSVASCIYVMGSKSIDTKNMFKTVKILVVEKKITTIVFVNT